MHHAAMAASVNMQRLLGLYYSIQTRAHSALASVHCTTEQMVQVWVQENVQWQNQWLLQVAREYREASCSRMRMLSCWN